jgi:nudix-type nucleoside diphosphatase (YffH/AdpP family)
MGGAQLPLTMPDLFVYGPLRHRPLFDALLGGRPPAAAAAREARLPGHRVRRQSGAPWPGLAADPGAEAEGMLWTGLAPGDLARLDAFGAIFGHERRPVRLRLGRGQREAEAYLPPPGLALAEEDWSLADWRRDWGEASRLAAEEIAAHDPPLAGASLRRQWGMLAHRAFARLRAAAGAPTEHRRAARPGDWALARRHPPCGAFFKLDGLELGHRRFDGGRNDGLPREVLVGADAALVLPYDARRDQLLLVEQFRTGPARRGDPQPWTLEPVAGLVDAAETPEAAARREVKEEAGLTVGELVPMFQGYASPGNATDHFYCFLAPCDLPCDPPRAGGLADEHEDLRLHILPFAAAMRLIATGEANAMPLISMLLWLAVHRDRLRASLEGGGGGA